jgi:hypothetical protein
MTKRSILTLVSLLLVSALFITGCGGKSDSEYQQMMGALAVECMDAGMTGPACELYNAHKQVEAAEAALQVAQAAYDAAHAPTPAPTKQVSPSATPSR